MPGCQKCVQGDKQWRETCISQRKKARTTEIQDSLIDRYVEQEEAIQEGNRSRAVALQFEIKELLREREHIKRFAAD